ncbi:MAG: alpha-L-fucosidase [Peptostreptococcaceae bacterium]
MSITAIRGDIEVNLDSNKEEQGIYPETEMLKERLEWFQDLKLGVIMHWGLYAEAGIVESWQLSEADEWAREPKAWRDDIKELQRDYWGLNKVFNPVNFNPDIWAKKCKEAGFKYLIFTTKHHDGFNMYDTKYTDYKITGSESPFKDDPRSDLLREIFDAFREEDIAVGAYYSKADWHSEHYWLDDDTVKGRRASYDTEKHPEIWSKYVEFVQNQLHEITHNYGNVDLLWLDAGWCGKGKEDIDMDKIAQDARVANPELIIVDRCMGGRHENYVTPERKIPDESEIPNKVWESNIPLGNDWGYVPTDKFKSVRDIVHSLIEVVSKGGNLILGVGPKPDGTLCDEDLYIMGELGKWLDINGEGIYGTRRAENIKINNPKFRVTKKQNDLYYFYLNQGEENPTEVDIFDLGVNVEDIQNVTILGGSDGVIESNKIKLSKIEADESFVIKVNLK